jgi:hypothetical protein
VIHPGLQHLAEAIDELEPYPGNPRRGRVSAIAESLERNGQYRPIVANRRTRQVLAGNHTLAAAKRLGWAEIAVAWVDVDESAARRIVLADNRTGDLGTYDRGGLVELLESLPDLAGTGYAEGDLARLRADDPTVFGGGGGDPRLSFGTSLTFTVDAADFDTWLASVKTAADPVGVIRARLGL